MASRRSILERTRCPRCGGALDAQALRCDDCAEVYPRLGGIPVLLERPREWLQRWAVELALLERDGAAQLAAVEATLEQAEVLPGTEARCRAMLRAAREQAAEIQAVLGPQLVAAGAGRGGVAGPVTAGQLSSPLLRLHYLFRDWGWDGGNHPENAQALAAIAAVGEGVALGRTLVLGAGAGRLSYDLYGQAGVTELAALDVDPVLLSFAARIVAGTTARLTETSSPAYEASAIARAWELAAPAAPVDAGGFHFLLADGQAPPFAPGTFDTVVTPWFIDHVPRDLRDFLGTVDRMLVPGGRWINHGPLIYPGEVPLARRFTREEIFELAGRAGFELRRWGTASLPHLVSPVNGRGRTEWSLTFAARKREEAAAVEETPPPSWLVLPHLPVPAFAGQTLFWHENPLIQTVVASIDGRRGIDEIARVLTPTVREMGLDPADLREAIRQCLGAVHPACARVS